MSSGGASPRVLERRAPAKVNLYLHVTGRREDGYHLLDSLVVFPAIGDRLRVAPSDELRLETDGPFATAAGPAERNLVMRAARALAAEYGIDQPGALISLTKELPVAAGLGGGSSDAAAALLCLSDLWGLPSDVDRLAEIGLQLGADVPVCLARRTSFVRAIGEDIEPGPSLPEFSVVLVNPLVAVPTRDIFKALGEKFGEPAEPAHEEVANFEGFVCWLSGQRNDLETVAMRQQPAIASVLDVLSAVPDCELARMSGSGATCFGVFADRNAAIDAASRIAKRHSGWWVRAAEVN